MSTDLQRSAEALEREDTARSWEARDREADMTPRQDLWWAVSPAVVEYAAELYVEDRRGEWIDLAAPQDPLGVAEAGW